MAQPQHVPKKVHLAVEPGARCLVIDLLEQYYVRIIVRNYSCDSVRAVAAIWYADTFMDVITQ
jgi:hypothetical protein